MTEKAIRESRIEIALMYDAFIHDRTVNVGWDADNESAADDSSVSGVELGSSLLDSDIAESDKIPNLMDDDLSEASDDTARTAGAGKGKGKEVQVDENKAEISWSTKLFGKAKITQTPEGLAKVKSTFRTDRKAGLVDLRLRVSGSQMESDWDYFEFSHDFNGHVECPFPSCV